MAAALLVTVVLPAEYGIDPLRTGRALGLTRLSAPPAAPEVAAPPAGSALLPTLDGPIAHYPGRFKADTTQFVLGPYEFVEYKYRLEKGAAMVYSWTGTAAVIHDFHGDPESGGRERGRQLREEGAARRQRGVHGAVFRHSWVVLGESRRRADHGYDDDGGILFVRHRDPFRPHTQDPRIEMNP